MPYAGVIIAASVLVAVGIAAYENPQLREWFEKSSEKVAVAFRSLGDDIQSRGKTRDDSSMHEDADEKAEERRRQARQEILERGKALQEKKRRRMSAGSSRTSSFDSMVDEHGRLKAQDNPWAESSGIDKPEGLRSRQQDTQMHDSVDSPITLRQLDPEQTRVITAVEPWESQYEQEMRNAWNIHLPARDSASSHASESLIDLTPTTEDFPDPDYSIPSLAEHEYFSRHPETRQPLSPLDGPLTPGMSVPGNTSVAGSASMIGHSEADMTDDDMSDDYGDGIRTPASAWTDVASSVSGDDR